MRWVRLVRSSRIARSDCVQGQRIRAPASVLRFAVMRDDQRVIELDLLAQLARQGGYLDMLKVLVEHSGAGAPLFKDLLLTLLLANCVTGAEPDVPLAVDLTQPPRDPHWHLWRAN